jgi:hypothetical protein
MGDRQLDHDVEYRGADPSRRDGDRAPAGRLSRRGFIAASGAGVLSAALAPTATARSITIPSHLGFDGRHDSGPLIIAQRGSFAAGGSVLTSPGTFNPLITGGPGQTLHGDHVYCQFEVPMHPRRLPLVMWHGGGQMGKTWESTTDGREGYQSIFLRRGFKVYIFDQPRRGRAGNTTQGITITPTPGDQDLFVAWRLGIWPSFYPDSQFPQASVGITSPALNQFFRQMTVDTGPEDPTGTPGVIVAGAVALLNEVGPSILLTHSASGILGWLTALGTPNVQAIYAYEPTDYVFPANNVPAPIGTGAATVTPHPVPFSEFLALTKIPIRIQYSDHIPTTSSPYVRVQTWVNRVAMGELMVNAINQNGGNASILHLPDLGILGNTHFSFADVNNLQIAGILSQWLSEHGLDRY